MIEGERGTMKTGMIVLVTLFFLFVGTGDLYAYTYTYNNRTGYLIRVTVKFYDDADKTGQIQANESLAFSTLFLLKSWVVEVILDNRWQEVLNLTCDMLPGNHTFSIYVTEVKDLSGTVSRSWYAINQ